MRKVLSLDKGRVREGFPSFLLFQERAGKECLSERHFGAFPLEESPPLNFPSSPFRRGRERFPLSK
jgi:hypothetical protein